MVLPFIQALGYDVFDPSEVVPEFTADYGIKNGEKVDYAIMRDTAPVFLIECKKAGDPLDTGRASQLARYFTNTPARIAILTNGLIYKFFSDLDAENAMDAMPFLEIDITKVDQRDIQALGHFTKHSFDLDEARPVASNMKHIGGMKTYLKEMHTHPDEEFVRLLARKVFTAPLFHARVEHFTGLVQLAFHGFVNDFISDTLQRASDIVKSDGKGDDLEAQEETEIAEEEPIATAGRKGIVTIQEELQWYELVKTIVSDCVTPERVTMRDTQSYCGILLDDTNQKPICRLYLHSPTRKYLGLLGQERDHRGRREEVRHSIETINDIANFAGELREAVRSHLGEEYSGSSN